MKEKQGDLTRIIEPVVKEIKLGMILAGIASICYVLAFSIFAFVISYLANAEINYTLLSVGTGFIIAEYLLRSNAFRVSHVAAFKLEQILRTKLSEHIAAIPFGEVITKGSGKLKKSMLDDVKNLHSFVADTTPMLARVAVTPMACLIALGFFDLRLLALSLALVFVSAAVMSMAFKDNAKYRKEYDDNQALINASIIEFVQAMPVVRTFSDGASSFKRYNDALNAYCKSLKEWIALTTTASRVAIMLASPIITLVVVGIAGSYLYMNGSLEFGKFIGALILAAGIIESMIPLMWVNNFVQQSRAAASGILEILDIKPLKISDSFKEPKDSSVEFKNVSFKYETRDEFALKDVNFKVEAGSVTALVGPSGAGKSTAAQLIPRFWDVNEGEILIGGVDVRQIEPMKLMNFVSFVFQDTFLFNDTVYENISMAKPNATRDEVISAAKAAQIHEFIETLPNGYDTICGDRGANLSGGQKQRITIARAILRDAPIIVLDEATAFADPENEEKIIKAISNLIIGKTVIIIAHRLSTIKKADQIVVFDKGKVVENGLHEELLANDNLYSKLWDSYTQTQIWNIHKGSYHE
ncbi:ABC transporter ATP-binding protein [Campylobacter sp. RM16187]|uniref:ABC transporter ATP-binding protein n=1 Tax=Campylobacter sp. RM16187 TaxID=1660063 RepID=UPI0021B5611E|nr:ABC transporter ATP-binding protein [Campylobacter sp. RM16187]QKG29409.1 ABC transporter, ATP-binding/permease protein [Campylobacter sp. RM16187]